MALGARLHTGDVFENDEAEASGLACGFVRHDLGRGSELCTGNFDPNDRVWAASDSIGDPSILAWDGAAGHLHYSAQ